MVCLYVFSLHFTGFYIHYFIFCPYSCKKVKYVVVSCTAHVQIMLNGELLYEKTCTSLHRVLLYGDGVTGRTSAGQFSENLNSLLIE